MKFKPLRRRFRLRVAPPGSRADAWIRRFNRFVSKLRTASLEQMILRLLPSFVRAPLRGLFRRWKVKQALSQQAEVTAILKAHPDNRRVWIFPPSLDWNTQLFQRPQQIAMSLARQGELVFYLQPPRTAPGLAFECLQDHLYLCRVPPEAFDGLEAPLLYLLTWNRKYAGVFRNPRVIYDYVDEIEVFDGDYREMVQDHHRLVETARMVITTAERLYRQIEPIRSDALLCPNGVDYDHFAHARPGTPAEPPADLAPIVARNRPVVGYYGALAVWFDYDLFGQLARLRPDLSFVLIGPDYDGTLSPGLLDLPNVDWLGVKPYHELPGYLRYFDVAMIPFRLNNITHSTSPLKLFEYLAAGRPVVITPMQESMRTGSVLVGRDAAEFSSRIDQALQLKDDPEFRKQLDQIARQNTWDARARQILSALV